MAPRSENRNAPIFHIGMVTLGVASLTANLIFMQCQVSGATTRHAEEIRLLKRDLALTQEEIQLKELATKLSAEGNKIEQYQAEALNSQAQESSKQTRAQDQISKSAKTSSQAHETIAAIEKEKHSGLSIQLRTITREDNDPDPNGYGDHEIEITIKNRSNKNIRGTLKVSAVDRLQHGGINVTFYRNWWGDEPQLEHGDKNEVRIPNMVFKAHETKTLEEHVVMAWAKSYCLGGPEVQAEFIPEDIYGFASVVDSVQFKSRAGEHRGSHCQLEGTSK